MDKHLPELAGEKGYQSYHRGIEIFKNNIELGIDVSINRTIVELK